MRNLLLLLSFLSTVTFTQAQSLDYSTHSIISKRTASWCSNCGRHGWDMKESILAASADKPEAMLISVHTSGDYDNATSLFFANYIGGSGQPQFIIDRTVVPFSASTIPAATEAVMTLVEENLAVESPVGLDVEARFFDDQLSIEVGYAYDGSDVYKSGVYTVRNNYVAPQAARGADAVHQRMLWDFLTDNVEGDVLADDAGTYSLSRDLSILDGHPIEDTQILVVIWKETATGREYVNGRLVDISELTIDTEEIVIEGLVVRQAGQDLLVTWSGAVNVVSLYAMDGRQVARSQVVGQQNTQIGTLGVPAGIYVVTLDTADGRHSEQIVIK